MLVLSHITKFYDVDSRLKTKQKAEIKISMLKIWISIKIIGNN